jgi:hypothetical protein
VYRRSLVAALAALGAGCLADLPSATGPRSGPTPSGTPGTPAGPTVADVDVEATDDDLLRVVATVRNRGTSARTTRVVVTVTVAGEESVREASVSVAAGETATASVEFDVAFDEFAGDGSVSARVR